MAEEYQGWTNHATWAVNLWIGDDEISYRALRLNVGKLTPEVCKRFVTELIPKSLLRSIFADISNTVWSDSMLDELTPIILKDVNWEEICEAWNEE